MEAHGELQGGPKLGARLANSRDIARGIEGHLMNVRAQLGPPALTQCTQPLAPIRLTPSARQHPPPIPIRASRIVPASGSAVEATSAHRPSSSSTRPPAAPPQPGRPDLADPCIHASSPAPPEAGCSARHRLAAPGARDPRLQRSQQQNAARLVCDCMQ